MIDYRGRWPLILGGLLAFGVLVAFAVTPVGDSDVWNDSRPLGIPLDGWGIAVTVLAAALTLQLARNARFALQRERRLVETAAALRQATADLERLATTDTLTGLSNRRYFAERLGVEFRRAERYGRPLSVLMVDLDHFKQVNDTHGHLLGDAVLATTAHTIREQVRESDVVARYGGEEFVLMLPETSQRAALTVAEKLRAAIAAAESTDGARSARLTASVGVATYPDCTPLGTEDLVRLADTAMYEAKRAGRNRVMAAQPRGAGARGGC